MQTGKRYSGRTDATKRTKTSVTLRNDLLEELKVEAHSNSWSLSRIIEIGLRDWLDVHKTLKGGRRTVRIGLV